MDNPLWARNRFTHFIVVAADLLWKVTKQGADIWHGIQAIKISWALTQKEKP